jgi:CRP/FNR family transcriptional regulator, anaerobic regulatory protein
MASAPQRCLDCLVRDKSLCAAVRDDDLHTLSTIGHRRVIPRGQAVTWAGDANTLCANVVTGALKLTATTDDGREQIVGLLFPGDFVGQPFADQSAVTATTLYDSDLCMFPRIAFERSLGDHPTMERLLLERTMKSLIDARDRMLTIGRLSAQERVARYLSDILRHGGVENDDGSVEIELPLSRGDMADYLALTIETVSRQMTALKNAGLIDFAKGDRHCRVLHPQRLAGFAEV